MFVFSPALLLVGTLKEVVLAVGSALIGVYFLASGVSGWLLERTTWMERVLAVAAGMVMMVPGLWTDVGGVIIGAIVVMVQIRKRRARVFPEQPVTG
jgi:TRAP-type uncharacterized transport system fused permease subunit